MVVASRQAGRVLHIRAEKCPRVLDLQHGLRQHHTRNDRSSIKTWLRTHVLTLTCACFHLSFLLSSLIFYYTSP